MLAQAQSLKLLPKEQEQLEHLLPDKELPPPVEQVPKVLSSLVKEVPILLLLPDKALSWPAKQVLKQVPEVPFSHAKLELKAWLSPAKEVPELSAQLLQVLLWLHRN